MNRNQYHMQEVMRASSSVKRGRSSAKPWAGWGNGERKFLFLNELYQPINENKHQLATQLGYFAREGHLFPLDVPTWKHMKQHDLDTIWENVEVVFNLQERSKINKQNKAQQTIVHTIGSKGFHCLEYEMTQETREHPKMKSFLVRMVKVGCKEAKKVYEYVEALQIQPQSESGVTIDEDQMFPQVLGHISSHIRGRGAGPKPVSSSKRAREKEKDNARDKQVVDARREADEAIRMLKACKMKLINLRKTWKS